MTYMNVSERARNVLHQVTNGVGIYVEATTLEFATPNGDVTLPVEVVCRRFQPDGPDGRVDVYPLAVVVNDDVMLLLAKPGADWTMTPLDVRDIDGSPIDPDAPDPTRDIA